MLVSTYCVAHSGYLASPAIYSTALAVGLVITERRMLALHLIVPVV